MLQTRLWMGALLAGCALGVVLCDGWFAPWYPGLLLILLGLSQLACFELRQLLKPQHRPRPWLCPVGVAAVLLGNWLGYAPPLAGLHISSWLWVLGAYAAFHLLVFLVEMASFREPGESIVRMAVAIWIVAYLGLLPSFLAQLRWLGETPAAGTTAILLTIFVPKCCDIGAYFTGRLLGRHRMTPVLSPKKTWEGAAGGLILAALTAIGLDRLGPVALLRENLVIEIAFGMTVGIAGMLGDLAESLIKRDSGHKDASQVVPGFGGVLDVVDAVLFAAPVAYLWFGFLATSSAN